MSDMVLVVLLLVMLLLLAFTIPIFRVRSAMRAVVKIFRDNNITEPEKARTSSELKLNPKKFYERAFSVRDYKPDALKVLIESGIIVTTDDNRLYLSLQKLAGSHMKKYIEPK